MPLERTRCPCRLPAPDSGYARPGLPAGDRSQVTVAVLRLTRVPFPPRRHGSGHRTGKYDHLTFDAGHNVPQAFARAVVDVDRF
jgi:hypothetical protein